MAHISRKNDPIIESRTGPDGVRVYKVHWKGYADEQDTWEPKENLDQCTELLVAYKHERRAKKERGVSVSVERHTTGRDRGDGEKVAVT